MTDTREDPPGSQYEGHKLQCPARPPLHSSLSKLGIVIYILLILIYGPHGDVPFPRDLNVAYDNSVGLVDRKVGLE